MSDFLKVCAFASVLGAVLLFLSEKEKEFFKLATAVIYILACIYTLGKIQAVREQILSVLQSASATFSYRFISKLFGIAFAGAVSSSICDTLGQKEIGGIIDLLTVTEILYLAVPQLKEAVQNAVQLLGM